MAEFYEQECIRDVPQHQCHIVAKGRTYLARPLNIQPIGSVWCVYILTQNPRYEGQKPFYIRKWEEKYIQ